MVWSVREMELEHAVGHVVGNVGAVGVAKTGRLVCKVVVSGPKGGVVVGTRCGAGTA